NRGTVCSSAPLTVPLRPLSLLADELTPTQAWHQQIGKDENHEQCVDRPDVESIAAHLQKFAETCKLHIIQHDRLLCPFSCHDIHHPLGTAFTLQNFGARGQQQADDEEQVD